MNLKRFIYFSFTLLLGALQLPACRAKGSRFKSPVSPTTPSTGGTVIPPTPVIGASLTFIAQEYNGSPFSQATVRIEGANFETLSSPSGEFAVPVEALSTKTLKLKLIRNDRIIAGTIQIPSELISPLNQSRVDAGVAPLEGEPMISPSKKLPDGSTPEFKFTRKLGLRVPDNQGGSQQGTDISQDTPGEQKIEVSSLPNTESVDGKKIGMWSAIDMLNTESAVRFDWADTFFEAANLRLVFAKTATELSDWDGKTNTAPAWPNAAAGLNIVSNSSSCTETGYGSLSAGPLVAQNGGKCGILRSSFPFSEGENVYVRWVGESQSELKLSPVFLVRPNQSNTPPTLTLPPLQTTDVNQPIRNIPLTLNDAESALSCSSALTMRSSNSTLLSNTGIVVGGTTPNCLVSIYPKVGQIGTSELFVMASDGELVTTGSFKIIVNGGALTPTFKSPLRALLTGYCDQNALSHQATSTLGGIHRITCSGGVLSIEVHFPAGPSESVSVDAWSEYSTGSGTHTVTSFQRMPFLCPAGYLGVPASGVPQLGNANAAPGHTSGWLDTNRDFCVMKYPAKNNGSSVAVSVHTGVPWVSIYRGFSENDGALKACADAGLGYRLMSNTQWQTVARNIESVAINWSGKAVGVGVLPRGHSDNLTPLDHPDSDADGYFGTGNNAGQAVGSGWEQRRTQTLSTGDVVWDIGGNLWQWVSDNVSEMGFTPISDTGYVDFSNLSYFPLIGTSANINRLLFAPQGNYGLQQYVGTLHSGPNAVSRGFGNIFSDYIGLFSADLWTSSNSGSGILGFRCTYLP